jgi:hypothetical protein
LASPYQTVATNSGFVGAVGQGAGYRAESPLQIIFQKSRFQAQKMQKIAKKF